MTQSADHEVDLLVVGSGNGGLTAALCAYEFGVKDVLIVEKSEKFGGTSATSGGVVWAPCNRYARKAGVTDSFEAARAFLRQTIPAGLVPSELLDTYVHEASRMIDFLHERTRVKYRPLANVPGAPELRSLEPEPLNRSELGAETSNLRDSHRFHCIFDRITMTTGEALALMTRVRGWRTVLFRLLWTHFSDVPWVLTHRRSRRVACGAAGIARLRLSLMDRKIPLWLNSALDDLIADNAGQVVGASITRNGQRVVVRARRGVILAAGGFEHNQAMRERYLPKPTNFEWSAGAGTNCGDALRAALSLGAQTRLMSGAYFCSTYHTPDHRVPWHAIIDKPHPGSCVVNRAGKRIANESSHFIEFQLELFRKHTESEPQVPTWMIFDARFRRRYLVGPIYNSRLRPDWSLPKSYFSSGLLTRARTIEELARKTGIDPHGLDHTVALMNDYAKSGRDRDFHRGETEYDRAFGDPTVKPNPSLAPIAVPPFYAIRIEPGDIGTQGGLDTDTHARVLNRKGEAIVGLYAIGNCAAALCPTYPTGGCTLGPAMTFGWQAARHIARVSDVTTGNAKPTSEEFGHVD